MPVPYRLPVVDRIKSTKRLEFRVYYRTRAEVDRHWHFEFLRPGDVVLRHGRHAPKFAQDALILKHLREFRPGVVVITGYGWPFLLAAAWTYLSGNRLVVHTDGTLQSEQKLSKVHRGLRKVIKRLSAAYVGTGRGSKDLYRQLGVPADAIFTSPLAISTDRYISQRDAEPRDIDLLYCGRMVASKNPRFVLKTAEAVSTILGRPVRVAFVGEGPLREELERDCSSRAMIQAEFPGFVQFDQMVQWFARAKVFVFPTLDDPWGLVINEAVAGGAWVAVSPYAGAADLVDDDRVGRVLDLDVGLWGETIAAKLKLGRWPTVPIASHALRAHTFDEAANGIVAAIDYARLQRD